LPELAALAETKTKAELDAHRVDPHLLAAAGFVWQSARLTARDVQALAASAEHACLFELVDDFAQVSRIRDLLAKNLGALRTKVRAKEGEIEARKASGVRARVFSRVYLTPLLIRLRTGPSDLEPRGASASPQPCSASNIAPCTGPCTRHGQSLCQALRRRPAHPRRHEAADPDRSGASAVCFQPMAVQ
jgi:hypothetical protein